MSSLNPKKVRFETNIEPVFHLINVQVISFEAVFELIANRDLRKSMPGKHKFIRHERVLRARREFQLISRL